MKKQSLFLLFFVITQALCCSEETVALHAECYENAQKAAEQTTLPFQKMQATARARYHLQIIAALKDKDVEEVGIIARNPITNEKIKKTATQVAIEAAAGGATLASAGLVHSIKKTRTTGAEPAAIAAAVDLVRPWVPTPTTCLYIAAGCAGVYGIWRFDRLLHAEVRAEKMILQSRFEEQMAGLRREFESREERLSTRFEAVKREIEEKHAATLAELGEAKDHMVNALAGIVALESDVERLKELHGMADEKMKRILAILPGIQHVLAGMQKSARWDVEATKRVVEAREEARRLGIERPSLAEESKRIRESARAGFEEIDESEPSPRERHDHRPDPSRVGCFGGIFNAAEEKSERS